LTLLRRIPGTVAAGQTQCTPLSAGVASVTFSRSDRPLPEPFHRGDSIGVCSVGVEYLKAAGIRLVRGRFLNDDDFEHPGTAAVINEAAARTYFPGEDPVGKQILGTGGGPWKTVAGVIADTKNQGLNHGAIPEVFLNDASAFGGPSDLLFLVRTLANEGALARALREGLRVDHPGIYTRIQTLDEAISQLSASPRFNTVLLSTFAAVAFLMAIVGVYGVLAFSVTQRRQEIGIRMALGASPRAVIGMVMKEGAALLAAGALAGVAGALLLTRSLATLLYGVTATDPIPYAAVVMGLAAAAAAAGFLPAHRAATLDPGITLRHE